MLIWANAIIHLIFVCFYFCSLIRHSLHSSKSDLIKFMAPFCSKLPSGSSLLLEYNPSSIQVSSWYDHCFPLHSYCLSLSLPHSVSCKFLENIKLISLLQALHRDFPLLGALCSLIFTCLVSSCSSGLSPNIFSKRLSQKIILKNYLGSLYFIHCFI